MSMKYVKKIPPTDLKLKESLMADGWEKIKEPSSFMAAVVFSLPFMILAGIIGYLIISHFDNVFVESLKVFIEQGTVDIDIRFDYILYTYLVILLHELLHAVLIPGFPRSDNTCFGIRPWGGFVFTTERMAKCRFLVISVAPFILLSVLLPVILGFLGLLSGIIAFIVMLNALASSVDLLNAFLVLIQVPGGSTMVNNGFETYYKKE